MLTRDFNSCPFFDLFLFHFDHYYGNDRVVDAPWLKGVAAGDCLLIQGDYFLVLGEEVIWGCDYELNENNFHVAEKKLLLPSTLHKAHWMVKQYFSSYKNVIPLWLGSSIAALLSRKKETSKKKTPSSLLVRDDEVRGLKKIQAEGQQSIVVFPSVRAVSLYGSDRMSKSWVGYANSTLTEKQRNSLFRKIKTGEISTLLCTPSRVFQDWSSLVHTHLHQPHQRWYKNRQDPRYDVVDVIEQLGVGS